MVSTEPIPWYNRPPRPFPAKVWLEARYPFRVPRPALAWATIHAATDGIAPRPFPALVWLRQRGQEGWRV
jgi:hypothetical protein